MQTARKTPPPLRIAIAERNREPAFVNANWRNLCQRLFSEQPASGHAGFEPTRRHHWLVLFSIDHFALLSQLYGEQFITTSRDLVFGHLERIGRELVPGGALIVENTGVGKFVALFTLDRDEDQNLAEIAMNLRLGLRSAIRNEALQATGHALQLKVGYSHIDFGAEHAELGLYRAYCDAEKIALGEIDPAKLHVQREFRTLIDEQRLATVYQPIVDLDSGLAMGWEALTRGPANTIFHRPDSLFDLAEEFGAVFSLEKACRELAIQRVSELAPQQKLFLNIHPRTLVDSSFCPGETKRLLQKYGLKPENVVLEITERQEVKDFTLFHRTLQHYRGQGFHVAVDDVGAGYSGLWSIAEIKPDFLKIDMSLVRGINENSVKRALMETLVAFADKTGSKIIAEGIETASELETLVSMGVHYGQGYYLGRPAFPKQPPVLCDLLAGAKKWGALGVSRLGRLATTVAEIAVDALLVSSHTLVIEVERIFQADEGINSVVVMDKNKPAGLIMRHLLYRALSAKYGVALHERRPVSMLMDDKCLTVSGDSPVEYVAKLAMNRPKLNTYDDIVVSGKGEQPKIVSVRKLIDTLAVVQIEMAKGANPLTGLPGNLAIEQEIEARSARGESFAIIYADLDNFKIYNDKYGFKAGDDIILLISRVLNWAVQRHGSVNHFVGHIGGDDFVLLVAPEKADRVSLAITRCFGRTVKYQYTEEDRARGVILGKDRSGREGEFPLVSVSLAILDVAGHCDICEVAERAAAMKKFAKSIPGNSTVRDRRGPLGPAGTATCN